MRIILVAQNYHPFVGGVETHVRQVAHELAHKHRVEVIAANFLSSRIPRRLAMLNTNLLAPSYNDHWDDDVPVHALTPQPIDRIRMAPIAARAIPKLQTIAYHQLNRFGYPWYRWVYLPRIREIIREADVVHSLAGGYLGWTAQEAARRLGKPFVCTPFVHPHQWGDGPEDVEYYQQADAVIGLVQTDADYLEEIGVPKIKLCVIGVSPDIPETADADGFRAKHGLSNKPFVLYVGRMMAQKGAAAVLSAATLVWEKNPDVRFVFIGPASTTEQQQFHDLDPRIQYLGKVSQQEKADALAACTIFCMPSMSEILPTVYLEAWSYGKAVIGGCAHGLPELVEGNDAGIAAAQCPAEVSAAICSLVLDPEKRERMGQRGKALVEERYSVHAVSAALSNLYSEVRIEKQRSGLTRN